jgi:ADP-heptose:LPS heptosyltransferase
MNPQNILLIKSHSMGIGDLLRSSAAWVALKSKWPRANLHLLMLSKHAGYPSEEFIRSHNLLSTAHFVTVKWGEPGREKQRSIPMSHVIRSTENALSRQAIDLIIDFEPSGIKTSRIARHFAKSKHATSVGVAQFPLRHFFYDLSAPSTHQYVKLHGLSVPMDYTEKDFVVLEALGIKRNGTRIALRPSDAGVAWMKLHSLKRDDGLKVVVLNIGCGTPDAENKRPALADLAASCVALFSRQPFQLHLSGAKFEKNVNAEFASEFRRQMNAAGQVCELIDWAGLLSLDELSGLLAQADMAISSDSGPFHMAVALSVPTLCWFNFDTPASYHTHSDVRCMICPSPAEFASAAIDLLNSNSAG